MQTVACSDCDLLQSLPDLAPGDTACCPRCGSTLATEPADPVGRPLALTLAAAIVFLIANTTPLMTLSAVGRHASTTIAGGIYEMWLRGEPAAAAIVAFCAVIAPGCHILFLLTVLLAATRPPAPAWVGEMLRWARFMQPWSMNEVMILGILVALVKIAQLATVDPGIGIYALGLLVVLFAAINMTFDAGAVWQRIEWVSQDVSTPAGASGEPSEAGR